MTIFFGYVTQEKYNAEDMETKQVLWLLLSVVVVAMYISAELGFLLIRREMRTDEVKLDKLKMKSEQFLVSPYQGHGSSIMALTNSKLKVHLELSVPTRIFVGDKVGIRIIGGFLILERSSSITKYLPENWSPADVDTINIFPRNSQSRVQAPMKVSKIAEEGAWRFDIQESQKMVFTTYESQGDKHLSISVQLYAGSGLIGISRGDFGSRQSTKITGLSPEKFISVEPNSAKMGYWFKQALFFLGVVAIIVSILKVLKWKSIIRRIWERIW